MALSTRFPDDMLDPAIFNSPKTSWLLEFPVEIFEMILKFAIGEKQDVWPLQMKERSNQFICTAYALHGNHRRMVNRFYSSPFVFHQLRRVSWAFYNTLPPKFFYGLHTFNFTRSREAFKFLASLTPLKRQAVKHVTIYLDRELPRDLDPNPACRRVLFPELVTLLCQSDLETLTLAIKSNEQYWGSRHKLDDILKLYSLDPSLDAKEHCCWTLPSTRVALIYEHCGIFPLYNEPWTEEEKASVAAVLQRYPRLGSSPILERIQNFRNRHEQIQTRLKEIDTRGEGIRGAVTQEKLCEALLASNIDFPGEVRIEQIADPESRYGYLGGGPARRTRYRTNRPMTSNFTEWGVIYEPRRRRINDEAPPYHMVCDLRWALDEEESLIIEVQVRNNDWELGPWESIEVIDNWGSYLSLLEYFHIRYKRVPLGMINLEAARQKLEDLEDQPRPSDIIRIILPILKREVETQRRVPKGYYQRRFFKYQKRLQSRLNELRHHIARLEAQEAREVARVTRLAKKAAKEAAKVARQMQREAKEAERLAKADAAATSRATGLAPIRKASGGGKRKRASAASEDADNAIINHNNDNNAEPQPKRLRRSPHNQ
ncbi:hypothetical protein F4810DRAFT_716974 [Camillea tinctor]|nr:hypothetical protein F4810DRAFT_716974 [Camillea tinctor]